jgi:hypothetical protein
MTPSNGIIGRVETRMMLGFINSASFKSGDVSITNACLVFPSTDIRGQMVIDIQEGSPSKTEGVPHDKHKRLKGKDKQGDMIDSFGY